MLAALATLACAMALAPEPGPGILAVVLCLSLSRSQLDRDLRGRLEAAVTLPAVSLAALGVAMLLRQAPWLGAALFTAALSVAIWMRRFGSPVRRAGALIALPFVVILTTPYVPTTRVSHAMTLALPVIIALLALFWVSVFHGLGRRFGLLVELRVPAPSADVSKAGASSSLRPIASTRMAVQMAIALAASFIVGYGFFNERWAWIVLTAYIVGSGNQGRLDVAYKSVLRVAGAGVGTVSALALTLAAPSTGTGTVVMILFAVFLGLWLRPLGYAWWALFVTLALALLQGFEGQSAQAMLWLRLEEIVIGAVIGVAAAWFVWPVRSTDVLRRRIADALGVLADALDPATGARQPDEFDAAVDRAMSVMPAFRASRWLTRRVHRMQPADWLDALDACRLPALHLLETGESPASVRRALGASRKALRDPRALGPALDDLRHALPSPRPTA
ncbi:MAG: hypothetical protein WDW36_002005 [Sanguina aurantia]